MEIIKLLPVNIFMAVKFPRLTFCCFLKGGNFGSLVSSGFFQKNQRQKLGILRSVRKGEKKYEWLRQQNLVT